MLNCRISGGLKSDLYCIWLRPISEEEIGHLKELHYAAIADKQTLIDEKLNAEVWPVTPAPHLVLLLSVSVINKDHGDMQTSYSLKLQLRSFLFADRDHRSQSCLSKIGLMNIFSNHEYLPRVIVNKGLQSCS